MDKTETVEINQPGLEEEISLDTVKKRTISGIIALTFRNFFLQIIGLVAFGMYSVFVGASGLGTYAIVSSIKNVMSYFSDIGLAGALIQKKEIPTEDDLRTTFLVQQALVIFLLVVLFFAIPSIQSTYQLSQEGVWLIMALGASFLFSSLRTIPTVMLERKLEFGKLIIPQIGDNLVFNILVTVLSYYGFGITSFTIALIAQGLTGVVLTYWIYPWKPGFAFSRQSLSNLLRFGVPFQANTFLAMIKDDGMTLVLGSILGVQMMGLLNWAQKWGFAPLRFFMDQVIRVTFPTFSHMQSNEEELKKALTRSIFFICFLVFPTIAGISILAPVLVQVVPRYAQYSPALLALTVFGINAGLAAVSTPLTNMLNATGHIKTTFKLMVMWTILTWVLVPYLAYQQGLNGVLLGYFLVGLTSFLVVWIARKYVAFDVITSVVKPFSAALGMAAVLLFTKGLMPPSYSWFFVLIIFGVLTYMLGIIFLVGPSIYEDGKKVIAGILGKKINA